jgi:hypothetical protein
MPLYVLMSVAIGAWRIGLQQQQQQQHTDGVLGQIADDGNAKVDVAFIDGLEGTLKTLVGIQLDIFFEPG